MNRSARIALLTLIMTCPVFTLLFMFAMNFWVQLIASTVISLAIAVPIVAYSNLK
jgi:predicted MFS family arabinose efflux permease